MSPQLPTPPDPPSGFKFKKRMEGDHMYIVLESNKGDRFQSDAISLTMDETAFAEAAMQQADRLVSQQGSKYTNFDLVPFEDETVDESVPQLPAAPTETE